jgi:hypothetical protein
MINLAFVPAGAEIDAARVINWVGRSLNWPEVAAGRLVCNRGIPALATPRGRVFVAVSTSTDTRGLERAARLFLAADERAGSSLIVAYAGGGAPPRASVAVRGSRGVVADVVHACEFGFEAGRVVLQAPCARAIVLSASGQWSLVEHPYDSWSARAAALAQASFIWAATAAMTRVGEAA